MHLAQLNVARLLQPIDHPQIKEFVDNIDRLNELAIQSEGFVWRPSEDTDSRTKIRYFNDPDVIVNLSVWESVEALKNYTYRSGHAAIMRRKKEWFYKNVEAHLVLWWIEEGHQPDVAEAKERLLYLREHGASLYAFTFKKVFEAE